jgi:HrpA-like RNA helicase
VRPGHAFRLCSEEDYQELLPDASVPEMQRSDLSSLLLQLKVRSDKEGTEEGCFFGVRVKEGSSQR